MLFHYCCAILHISYLFLYFFIYCAKLLTLYFLSVFIWRQHIFIFFYTLVAAVLSYLWGGVAVSSSSFTETQAWQSTLRVQEGNILDVMSVTFSTKNVKNILQSAIENTGTGAESTNQSAVLNKAVGFLLLQLINQKNKHFSPLSITERWSSCFTWLKWTSSVVCLHLRSTFLHTLYHPRRWVDNIINTMILHNAIIIKCYVVKRGKRLVVLLINS